MNTPYIPIIATGEPVQLFTLLLVGGSIAALIYYGRGWLREVMQLGWEMIGFVWWRCRALFFGYGTYLLITLTWNISQIDSWWIIRRILTFETHEIGLSDLSTSIAAWAGMIVGFYALRGGFSGDDQDSYGGRGRFIGSIENAKEKLRRFLSR